MWVLTACNAICLVTSLATFGVAMHGPRDWLGTLLLVGSLGVAGINVLVMVAFVAASLPLRL